MSTQTQKIEQDRINSDVAAFLSNGGEIQELAGYGLRTGTINPIEKSKRTNTKRSILAAQVRKTLKGARIAYLYAKNEGGFSCRNKELEDLEGLKLVRSFENAEQVNSFDFGHLIRNHKAV